MTHLIAAAASSPQIGAFLTWGIFGIQLGNLLVILAIVVFFVLALVVPFPRGRARR